jgi:hypothetical protein
VREISRLENPDALPIGVSPLKEAKHGGTRTLTLTEVAEKVRVPAATLRY